MFKKENRRKTHLLCTLLSKTILITVKLQICGLAIVKTFRIQNKELYQLHFVKRQFFLPKKQPKSVIFVMKT